MLTAREFCEAPFLEFEKVVGWCWLVWRFRLQAEQDFHHRFLATRGFLGKQETQAFCKYQ